MCIEALFLFQISQIRSLALLIFGHEVTQAVLRRLIISSETRCGIVAQGMTNPKNLQHYNRFCKNLVYIMISDFRGGGGEVDKYDPKKSDIIYACDPLHNIRFKFE